MSDEIGTYGESLYQQVLPLHGPDPDRLAHDYIGAISHPMREVDELVRDTPEGDGWSIILDPDDAPAKGLWWLAQLAGVKLRRPKFVTEAAIPNSNAEQAGIAGWESSAEGISGGWYVSTATALSGNGMYSGLSAGAEAGTWIIARPHTLAAMSPVRPNASYGFAITIKIVDPIVDAPLDRFQLDTIWYDRNLDVTYSGLSATASPLLSGDYTAGQEIVLKAIADAPEDAAYAGIQLRLPGVGTGAAIDSLLVFGRAVIAPVESTSVDDIPPWPYMLGRLETEDEWAVYARDAIKRQGGKQRGTVDAILSAAEDTLTRSKTARILERVAGNAWALELITRPSETPDPAATLAAATLQKPAGMSLSHTMTEGLLIDEDTAGTIDTAGGTIDSPID